MATMEEAVRQDFTPGLLRELIRQNEAEQARLRQERHLLVVQLEEAEGRPESLEARWARAVLTEDLETMNALRVEGLRGFVARFGDLPDGTMLRAAGFKVDTTEAAP